MGRRIPIVIGVVVTLLASASFAAPPVAAHEHVLVGPYLFTVGWRVEPPVVGVLNGLDLEVVVNETQAPVLNAHRDLNATLTKGSTSVTPSLVPQFGRAGWYTFDAIPTEPGNYSVRVFGNLDGTPVDFAVTLQTVEAASEVEFPRATPTPGDLRSQIAALQGQIAVLLVLATLGLLLAVVSTTMAVVLIRRLRPRT
jgi:hypothetical protein